MPLRSHQPLLGARLNRNHPDAQGLVAAIPCLEGTGYPADLVSSHVGGTPYGTGTFAWQDGGVSCSASLANTGITVPIQPQAAPTGFTQECWVKLLSNANAESWAGNVSASTWFDLPTGGLRFVYNTVQCGSSITPPIGQWLHIVGVVWSGGMQLWLNGVKIASNSSAITLRPIQSSLYTHNRGSGNANSANAVVRGIHAWTRVLDPSAIMRRYLDPWSLYCSRPRQLQLWTGAFAQARSLSSSDSAAETDSASLVAAIGQIDASTLAEVLALGATLLASDGGVGGESTNNAALLGTPDAGTLAEQIALALSDVDAATLVEASLIAQNVFGVDGAALTELLALNRNIPTSIYASIIFSPGTPDPRFARITRI